MKLRPGPLGTTESGRESSRSQENQGKNGKNKTRIARAGLRSQSWASGATGVPSGRHIVALKTTPSQPRPWLSGAAAQDRNERPVERELVSPRRCAAGSLSVSIVAVLRAGLAGGRRHQAVI